MLSWVWGALPGRRHEQLYRKCCHPQNRFSGTMLTWGPGEGEHLSDWTVFSSCRFPYFRLYSFFVCFCFASFRKCCHPQNRFSGTMLNWDPGDREQLSGWTVFCFHPLSFVCLYSFFLFLFSFISVFFKGELVYLFFVFFAIKKDNLSVCLSPSLLYSLFLIA